MWRRWWLVLGLVAWQAAGAAGPTASNVPVVLSLGAAGKVTASAGNPVGKLPPGPLADLLAGRTYAAGTSPGSVLLRDLLTKAPGPKGDMAVTAVRAVPWSAIAKGVGRAVPLVGTALAIKDVLDSLRCREAFGGGPECDDGQAEISQQQWCASVAGAPGGQVCASSKLAVCQGSLQYISPPPGGSVSCVGTESSPPSFRICYDAGCGGPSYSTPTYNGPQTVMVCPTAGLPPGVVPVKGADGKCPTGEYQPKTEDAVGDKVDQHGDKARAPAIMPELDQGGVVVAHPSPAFEVPPAVAGDRQRTEHPDGSVTIRDRDWTIEPRPDGYEWEERIRETNYPPGATIPPQGEAPTPGAPTTTTTGGAPIELKTCGLPGTPPCKIDETGTPTGQGVETAPGAQVEAIKLQGVELVTSAQTSGLPWMFAMELPAGACAPLVWTVRGHTITIDLCNNWLVTFWRGLLAWAMAAMAGLYIWRSVASATGAT